MKKSKDTFKTGILALKLCLFKFFKIASLAPGANLVVETIVC